MEVQGVLALHEFWAREKFEEAKFVLVKLCTSSFVELRSSEILSICYPRNGLYLKIHASEICSSQGPPVVHDILLLVKSMFLRTLSTFFQKNLQNICKVYLQHR